jgi:hypothetical protein
VRPWAVAIIDYPHSFKGWTQTKTKNEAGCGRLRSGYADGACCPVESGKRQASTRCGTWYLLGATAVPPRGSDELRSTATDLMAVDTSGAGGSADGSGELWTTQWDNMTSTTATRTATITRLRDAGDRVTLHGVEDGRDSRVVDQAIGRYLHAATKDTARTSRSMRRRLRGVR